MPALTAFLKTAVSALLLLTSRALAAPLYTRALLAERTETTLAVLQFACILEHLESAFYAQALKTFTPSQFTDAGYVSSQLVIDLLALVASDELTHVSSLDRAIASLGAEPEGPRCTFDFSSALGDVKTMIATARTLELVGVNAYLGGAALLASAAEDVNALTAAGQVLTVEARHSSLLNTLAGGSFQSSPFDTSLTPAAVLALAVGFVDEGSCDVVGATGVTPLPALKVSTLSPPLAPGSNLTFTTATDKPLPDANGTAACQMVVGGLPVALAFPLGECVVPEGLTGPVFIYVTADANPLQTNVNQQDASSILAGPALVFLDPPVPELLAQALQTFEPKAPAPSVEGAPAASSVDPLFSRVVSEKPSSGTTDPYRA